MAKKRRKDKPSLFGRILGGIERAGNRLPHPITLFALFTLGIILVSALCALLGVSATGELINSKTLELETQTVTAVSLLSKEGVVYMLTSMVSNFTSFAPLGVVLVTMLGIGCAEGSGYLSALLKKSGIPLYGAALREDTLDARAVDYNRCAIAIGSEGRGLTEGVLALCDRTIKIPMSEHCESLNAAAAATVLLWEAARND